MSDYIPSTLEHFPSELLVELFEYMSFNDLSLSFYNLNNRFDEILLSSNLHLRILHPDDVQRNAINQRVPLVAMLISIWGISRLRLGHDDNVPIDNHPPFARIRSLIFNSPSSNQLELIQPYQFNYLEYLKVGYTVHKQSLNRLHQLIFSNGFPSLRRCSLNNVEVKTDDQSWTQSPALRSLSMLSKSAPLIVIEHVLVASPNLLCLHLFLHWTNLNTQINTPQTREHFTLKRLKLHLQGLWSLEKFDFLFEHMPTIVHISVHTSIFDVLMIDCQWDFVRLANIFHCRLPKLCRFDCDISFKREKFIDQQQIHHLHPCFDRIQHEQHVEDEKLIRIFTPEC